ncbi:MAG TPA: glycosyl transferase family 1, partial [Paraburkholderia sp.]|nr:glycosyl transferase family 1 [Paraburkholderia sp.]
DEPRWLAAQQAGLARVRRFYTKKQMTDQYRVLYERLTAAPTRADGASGNAAAARGGCPMHHGAPADAAGAAAPGGSARIQPQEVR